MIKRCGAESPHRAKAGYGSLNCIAQGLLLKALAEKCKNLLAMVGA